MSCKPPPARQVSPAYTALFHAVPGCTCGTSVRVNVAGLPAASAASDGKMNVPNWFGVWLSSSRVPITSTPTFRRCAVGPGSQENSSAISRLRLSLCWGSPPLPPNASVAMPWPPFGRAEATFTSADGSARKARASRCCRAT